MSDKVGPLAIGDARIDPPQGGEHDHEAAERLVSYSIPSPGITAAEFLRAARGRERFYWRDANNSVTFAAFGVAADLMGWGETRFVSIQEEARALFDHAIALNEAEPLAAPRLFGGFAFRDDFVPDNTWSVFNPAHFILPHYQLVQADDESWLTINTMLAGEEDPYALAPQLDAALRARYEQLLAAADSQAQVWTPPEAETAVTNVRYPLPYSAWEQQIEAALARFAAGDLKKVVLSRVSEIFFSRRVDVDAALARLNRHFPHSYRFLFEPRPFHAFLGATPELLARVEGDDLETMALAGTIRAGETAAETAALGQQLLDSAKDRREHDLVVSSILRRLQDRVSNLSAPDTPVLHRVGDLQHLLTPINGRLTHPLGILAVAELLHPTPALGGSPRRKAMAFIQETEPAPRGWYAGPVGWIDHHLNGALAVAIRSAVAQERRAWLYAGAGVVAGSNPRREWEETGLKFGPMQRALGIVNGEL